MWHFSAVLMHRHVCSPNFLANLMFRTTEYEMARKMVVLPIKFRSVQCSLSDIFDVLHICDKNS